jgi:hypothetical protein
LCHDALLKHEYVFQASKKKKNRTSSGAVKEVSPQVANGDGYEIKSIGIDFSSDCVSLNKESRRESVVTHDELDVAAIVISGGFCCVLPAFILSVCDTLGKLTIYISV